MKTKYVLKENKIIIIKEENEELKAQSVAKSAMFKLKPEFEKLFDMMKKLNILESYKIRIEPYNRGYEMKFNFERVFKHLYKMKEEGTITNKLLDEIGGLFQSSSIYIQPDSFFQDRFDEGGYAQITGRPYSFEMFGASWVKQIKRKEDINDAEKEFVKINLENIKKATDILKKLSK
jgi:hypothetical protein